MGVLLDELAARRNVVSHKHRESPLGLGGVLYGHLAEKSGLRIHRSLPELLVAHLAEPNIAEDDRAARIKGWNKAVKCSYGWAKDE